MNDIVKRDRTFWRGMYLIAFVIGCVVPIASIVGAGAATNEAAWRSMEISIPVEEARGRSDVHWRQENVAVPVSGPNGQMITYQLQAQAYERRPAEGSFILLSLAWSAATLIGITGVAAAAWIVMVTGEKLGIDHGRGYLRGMFFMALATGALVPIAGIIAAGVTTADSPSNISNESTWMLVVMWCGMIAVCIAGLSCAAWLVKSAAAKLRPAAETFEPPASAREPGYYPDVEAVR